MFNKNSTRIRKDLDASKQNAILLLKTEKGELIGDPFYGIRLKKYLYSQNNLILKDIIIDEIYTQIALFLPQIKVQRKDIQIILDNAKLYCKIKGINQATMQVDSFDLVLYDENE
jgi:phage baseplate assembly protein W